VKYIDLFQLRAHKNRYPAHQKEHKSKA